MSWLRPLNCSAAFLFQLISDICNLQLVSTDYYKLLYLQLLLIILYKYLFCLCLKSLRHKLQLVSQQSVITEKAIKRHTNSTPDILTVLGVLGYAVDLGAEESEAVSEVRGAGRPFGRP